MTVINMTIPDFWTKSIIIQCLVQSLVGDYRLISLEDADHPTDAAQKAFLKATQTFFLKHIFKTFMAGYYNFMGIKLI